MGLENQPCAKKKQSSSLGTPHLPPVCFWHQTLTLEVVWCPQNLIGHELWLPMLTDNKDLVQNNVPEVLDVGLHRL